MVSSCEQKPVIYLFFSCITEYTVVMYDSKTSMKRLVFRALGKREFLVIIAENFCKFCIKPYFVTPHLNRLVETVQMRGHNIWFQ